MRGILRKMAVELTDPVSYWMRIGDDEIKLNDYIGKEISLGYKSNIHCVQCGCPTKKSYQQGHCFLCMRRINECDNCMLHPERCHVEDGTCAHDDWAHDHCHQEHIVYLANSSGLKVGITRHTHVPSRWIDQGASFALPIFEVKNRRQAGLVEVAFKKYVNDKTNWRVMLRNEVPDIDMHKERERLFSEARADLDKVIKSYDPGVIQEIPDPQLVTINYPVLNYPTKVSSLSLDKTPTIQGTLQGIKGQYLIFENGVLNVRKFGGYEVEFNTF
jgi:hypothetical protein